jgi:sugar/nucleoside kinase (ribokinase family)
MKRFNVYGIGHALVDMEFHVDDAFLRQAGLPKGSMTLVDEARQQQLLQQLGDQACHRACGGSAANTLIGLAQFGGRGFYSCQVAQDEAGAFFAQALRADGVENQLDPPLPAGTTGRCLVFITPDAERTMCTHLGISEQFSTTQLSAQWLAQAEYLYIEGYLVSSPSGREATVAAARMARQQGVKIALTFSDTSMITYFRQGLEAIIEQGVDLLFCNESEAMAFTGCQTLAQAQKVLATQAQWVGLTLGAEGAAIAHQGEWLRIPGIAVQAIDSNGAGDLFAGALLYGLTNGMTLPQAGQLACRAAALLVTQAGARLKAGQARTILHQQEQSS